MSCKKKEQSSCTSTPRRVLESLSIKDILQARADCFPDSLSSQKGSLSSRKGSLSSRKGSLSPRKGSVSPSVSGQYVSDGNDCNLGVNRSSHRKGSVSPSVSGQYVSDRHDCNLGVHRSSHHQWLENCGTCPQSRKQSKICSTPLCAEISAMIDGIQHCRDAIGALAQEAQSIICTASGLLDDCVCNKSGQTKKKHKKVKKVNSKSCCRKTSGQKGSNKDTCCVPVPSWMNNCVCDEAETKKRNKSNKVKTTESKQSCQKICGKKSSHKVTGSDCACNEKNKKQSKTNNTIGSKSCCQKRSSDKDSCICNTTKDLDDCFCEEDMKKQHKKVKKTGSECSFQKRTSDKDTCCVPPITADECACDANMKKQNKKVKTTDRKNCCQEMLGKKGSDKETCCIPPIVADDCASDAKIRKNCCQKIIGKKSSEKDTCCVNIAPKGIDDCVFEEDMKKQNNKEIISITDSKNSCQKLFGKKTSDTDTCSTKPVVFDDWACEGGEKKKQSAKKSKSASAAMSCGIPACAENSCTCRFPPAYKQYFDCTGQISGSCQCDKNN